MGKTFDRFMELVVSSPLLGDLLAILVAFLSYIFKDEEDWWDC